MVVVMKSLRKRKMSHKIDWDLIERSGFTKEELEALKDGRTDDKDQEVFVKGFSGTFQGDVSVVITDADKKWEILHRLRIKICHDTYGDEYIKMDDLKHMHVKEWAINLAMKLLGFE